MAKEGEGAVVRQTHLIAVVGAFMIGCTFVLLVGCSGDTGSQPAGSQNREDSQSAEAGSERTGPRESESTHEVAQHGGSPEEIPGYPDNSLLKGNSLLKVDGITYDNLQYSGELKDEDLGPVFAEVNRQSTSSTTKDQAASNEVPVYAIKGYDTSFRLAVRTDGYLSFYEVLSNPKAEEGSDVLDIGGKVRGIGISHMLGPVGGGQSVGYIEDPEKAERVVQGLMDAPIKPTSLDYYGIEDLDQYHVSFVLKDGTYVSFEYRMDTGRLSKVRCGGLDYCGLDIPASGIVAPRAFREAIEEGVDKPYQRQIEVLKRSCADTRTSQETRRVNSSGDPVAANQVAYTTNDVPDGPWGGVLRGTREDDNLAGANGEDEVHGLGGDDTVQGGPCDDKLYGGPGRDEMYGDAGLTDPDVGLRPGKDILYGGEGNDTLTPDHDDQRDEVYCGKGKDKVVVVANAADKIDYVDDSCEETGKVYPTPA